MRKLVAVRIVHAPSDMGSASAGLEKAPISIGAFFICTWADFYLIFL